MNDRFTDAPTLRGVLNIYTMETGDGREIELSVVDKYICWRRVNDVDWIQLVPLSAFTPVKEEDYWTEEDQREILEYVESKIGNTISHSNLSGRDELDQHTIDSITDLRSELDSKVSKVGDPVPGDLVTVDYSGNLIDCGINPSNFVRVEDLEKDYATKEELEEHSDYSRETYATKEELRECTTEDGLSSILSEYAKKDYVESLVSESIQGTVTVQNSGDTSVQIPEELQGYMNFYVYHNGVLLIRDTHYTVSEDSITLIGHTTYSGDIFSFVYVGSVMNKSISHSHSNKEILDKITQGDIDNWNSSHSLVNEYRVNGSEVPIINGVLDITVPSDPKDIGAAKETHTHEEYVRSDTIFGDTGVILPALLPSSLGNIVEVATKSELPLVGDAKTLYVIEDENRTYRWSGSRYVPLDQDDTLKLGETSDTAFRGDYGVAAYEHALETHAPPTAQENIIEVFKIAGDPLPVESKAVSIPIASSVSLGVVKSSDEPDKIRINEDGTMSLNKVSFSNLINTDEELLLSSGGAF